MATLEDLNRSIALDKLEAANNKTPTDVKVGVPFMTDDGPSVVKDGRVQQISQEQFDIFTGKTPTAGQVAKQALDFTDPTETIEGLKDPSIKDRSTSPLHPIGTNEAGERVFAVPESVFAAMEGGLEILQSIPKSAATAMAAIGGAPITGEELATTTLDIVVPGAGSIKGPAKVAKISSKLAEKELKKAPTTEQLIKKGGGLIDNYKRSGNDVSGDDLALFWVGADDVLKKEGFDSEVTPKIAGVMKSIAAKADNESLTAQDMYNMRRQIRSTMKSKAIDDEDRRLSAILLDEFDKFTLDLPGGKGWKEGRRLYAQGKKSDQIMDILTSAEITASGVENGVRQGLRSILKDKNKLRGFTDPEKEMMKRIVAGDFTSNTLKRLSKLGFGNKQQSNVLGGIAGFGTGAGTGTLIGGPIGGVVGAAVAPIVGTAAGSKLEANTIKAVKALRALAVGRKIPENIIFEDTGITPRILATIAAEPIATGAGTSSNRIIEDLEEVQ